MHQHTWRIEAYSLLSLPVDGFSERVLVWVCPCGRYCAMTGLMKLGVPLGAPQFWEAAEAEAQRQEHTP